MLRIKTLLCAVLLVGWAMSATAAQSSLLSGLYTTCASWDLLAIDKQKLLLSNNTWGSRYVSKENWRQCIHASDTANEGYAFPVGWSYDWLNSFDGEQWAVKAYPEVIYGNKNGIEVSGSQARVGLPRLLSELPSTKVHYAYSEQGSSNREINVAAESFIHKDCNIMGPGNPAGDSRVYEMMVWVQSGNKFPHRQPLTMAVIEGQLWNVFADPEKSKSYIAFIKAKDQPQGVLNWSLFLDWTRRNAPLLGLDEFQSGWCLGAIEFGTELWWGRGEFLLEQFDVVFE